MNIEHPTAFSHINQRQDASAEIQERIGFNRLRFRYAPDGCSVDMHGMCAYINHACLCGEFGGLVGSLDVGTVGSQLMVSNCPGMLLVGRISSPST